MSDLTERLRSKRSCTVCDGDGIKSNGKECGGCKGSGKVYRYDRTGTEAADEIDRLTRELAEARDKALEEAAKVADAHASTCLSKLNKKRSDHDLAVFESAASEAQSISHVVRAMKASP